LPGVARDRIVVVQQARQVLVELELHAAPRLLISTTFPRQVAGTAVAARTWSPPSGGWLATICSAAADRDGVAPTNPFTQKTGCYELTVGSFICL
jgi:hypothetical protein